MHWMITISSQIIACWVWYRLGRDAGEKRAAKTLISCGAYTLFKHARDAAARIQRDRKFVGADPRVEITNTRVFQIDGRNYKVAISEADEKRREMMG